jgi:hypothetical protein
VALAITLTLSLVAFILTAGEAWAAEQHSQEQPSQTAQHGTVESASILNGKVAEPVPGAPTPQSVVPPPVETPPTEHPTPPPPSNETPPSESPAPPPIDLALSTPEKPEGATPQPAQRPAPQWFADTTNGKTVESEPVLTTTSQSATDFGQVLKPETMPNASPDVVDPAPAPAAPAAPTNGDASEPASDPVLQLPAPGSAADSEQLLPAASGLAGLVQELVAKPAVTPVTPQGGDGSLLPTPINTAPVAGLTPLAPVPAVPASLGEALRLPSSLGTTAASAVGTVQSAAASVASATAEVFGSLAAVASPGTSSANYPTDGTQEQPSEGTSQQQPAPAPLAPPAESGFFSLWATGGGGGQLGSGSGFAPLLVGILALLTTIMLGRNLRTYLISCEMSKPSSALLLPLERPG